MKSMRDTILLLTLMQVLQETVSFTTDNSISEKPSVECDPDSISILFSTQKPFNGRIFVKGYVQDINCIQLGSHREENKFTIKFNQCGLRRSREYNGIRITSVVIVSFHLIFLTKLDRAYRLNCFYLESPKRIAQQLEISMMTTEEIQSQTQMPVCRYEILYGGATGVQVRYAKVGDKVYHKWSCLSETKGLYCMRVHTCTVTDGQGGETVTVLDKKGCSVDKYLLLDLEYADDLTAGQESYVFKFADRPMLYFNCQLELTTKDYQFGCTNERPICKNQIRVKPSEQTYEQANHKGQMQIYPASSYTDDKSNEVSYHNDDMIYSSPVGPSASPIRSSDSSHLKSSEKSSYPVDNEYQDTSTTSYAEEYGRFVRHETEAFDEDEIDYKRLIRRKRNSTNQHFSFTTTTMTIPKLHVVNVDLPEQCITVFDLEDDNNAEMQSINFDQFFDPIKNSRTCFLTARLAILLIIAIFAIFVLAVIFVWQKWYLLFANDRIN